MNLSDNYKNIWIGLWEVRVPSDSDLLEGCSGAFVQIIGHSKNQKEFTNKVNKHLIKLGFIDLKYEQIDTVLCRINNGFIDENILKNIHNISDENNIVLCGFDGYP